MIAMRDPYEALPAPSFVRKPVNVSAGSLRPLKILDCILRNNMIYY